MAMRDAAVEFVSPPPGAAQSMVAAVTTLVAFNNVIDLLGQGAGTAPANIIGNATLFGQDPWDGIWRPEIQVCIGTAFTTGTAMTPEFAIQVAPDAGTPTYQPGTWETAVATGLIPIAECTAGQIFRLTWPAAPPGTPRPRFVRMAMLSQTAANLTAGTIAWACVFMGADNLQSARAATKNYVVA